VPGEVDIGLRPTTHRASDTARLDYCVPGNTVQKIADAICNSDQLLAFAFGGLRA
jgi:hypothetical protein